MSNRIRTALISFLVAVWAVNITAPVFVHDYKPTPELNIGFTAALGVLLSGYKKNSGGDDEK